MRAVHLLAVSLLLLIPGLTTTVGCGQKSGAPQLGATPEAAVHEFLDAVRLGDSKRASQMLTPMTRQKTAEMKLDVTPEASPSASFAVGQVEYVTEAKDGAHVASKWTDKDDQGNPFTRDYLWILRKEDEGWRVAGMAAKVFEDEEPLILNFEDPQDMVRKQELVAEEMARREAEQNGLQARQPGGQEDRR